MPLTLLLTEGVIPKGQEKVAMVRLSEAMLAAHGLTGNAVMSRNVIGHVQVLPRDATFTGMEETPVAIIEWKVPSFAFTDPGIQRSYFETATDIIHEMSGKHHPKDKVFINVVHSVDGAWNFDGRPMTNSEIGAAVSKG